MPEEDRKVKVLSNLMVDLKTVVDIDPAEVGVTELVYYPVLANLLEESAGDIDELKDAIRRDIHDLIPKHKKIFSRLSTTICIWNMDLEMMMISTTSETDVSVLSVSCFRTSTESVFQDWRELYVSV